MGDKLAALAAGGELSVASLSAASLAERFLPKLLPRQWHERQCVAWVPGQVQSQLVAVAAVSSSCTSVRISGHVWWEHAARLLAWTLTQAAQMGRRTGRTLSASFTASAAKRASACRACKCLQSVRVPA